MSKGRPRASVRVDPALWRSFQGTAVRRGLTPSELLRQLVAREAGAAYARPVAGLSRASKPLDIFDEIERDLRRARRR
jgi:hypothetical protein